MTTLLAFLFVLGVLIFVHELGHFLAARRHGVRVLTFSLGFGPKILRLTRGGTEYCVSVIPLGGYVKMAGENPDDPRSGQDDEFLSKTKWQRFQILFAGPLMNIVLAIVVLAVVLSQGAEVAVYLDQPPVVGTVVADSPAAEAGIQRDDLIVSVAGTSVDTWEDLLIQIATRPARDVVLELRRDGRTVAATVRPVSDDRYEIGNIGVLPDINPIITSVIEGEGRPAEAAGLRGGDVVLALNGTEVVTRAQLIDGISSSPGREVTLTVVRDGRELTIRAVPELQDGRGMLGFYIGEPTRSFKPGPVEAVRLSVERNYQFSGIIFRTLGGLVTGQNSVRQLQGPVGIAQLSGDAAEQGFLALLSLMALLSINLGILNLMPVPVLDGGHILILLLEGVSGRDFSMRFKELALLFGFVVLMMLMVTVVFNDLMRIQWIEELVPWRN